MFNLKNTKKVLEIQMKNYDFQEKQFQISDSIESYFECISTYDVKDVIFIQVCGKTKKMMFPNISYFEDQ